MTEPSSTIAPPLGLLARALGVITSPAATFRSVVAHPRPVGILFIVCLLMGLATGLPQFTERGRAAALEMQIRQTEQFSGQPVAPEARAGMEQMARFGGYFAIVSMFIFLPVITILVAGLYWLVFNVVLGGTADFKQVLAVVSHSQIILAVGTLIGAPIQYFQGAFTPAGPFHLGALAAALDPAGSLSRLLNAVSIVGIWQSIVAGIGLAVLYRRRSTGIIITLLAIYVGMTAFFYVFIPSLFSAGPR